jgi:hypothetical protein
MTAQDYSEALAHEVARRRDSRIRQLLVTIPLDARTVNEHLAADPYYYTNCELPHDADIPQEESING